MQAMVTPFHLTTGHRCSIPSAEKEDEERTWKRIVKKTETRNSHGLPSREQDALTCYCVAALEFC